MFVAGFIALGCLAVSSAAPASNVNDGFPVQSCDKSLGKVCIPDACNKATCSLIKDAVCIADRCGCQARWFLFDKEKKMYQEVSEKCGAFKVITDFGKFMDKQQDEDAQVTVSPDQLLTFFRKLNSLTSEALEYIARNLKQAATENPSQESLQRFEAASALLKSLQRSKRTYDAAVSARSVAHGHAPHSPTVFKPTGKGLQDPEEVQIMDEDTGDVIQAKINWGNVWSGVKQFGKGVLQGATSDEDQDEDTVQPKINWGNVWSGVKQFGKGVLQGATSDENEDEDKLQDAPLSTKVLTRGHADVKIASLLTKDGPFADVLADPEARVNWNAIGQGVGKVGKFALGLLG